MSEWAKIDAWMRDDSPWLFQPREPVRARGRKAQPDTMAQMRLLADRGSPSYLKAAREALELAKPATPYRRALRLALLGSSHLTSEQAKLAVRLIDPQSVPARLRVRLVL